MDGSQPVIQCPEISIIIPTFRRFEPLLDTIDDVLRQQAVQFELLVADQNASWPPECATRLASLKADPRVRWIEMEPIGVVHIRNAAVERSTAPVIVFLDDDVRIPRADFLYRHLMNYEQTWVSAVVGREMYTSIQSETEASHHKCSSDPTPKWSNDPPIMHALRFDRNSDRRCEVNTFCTCNSSIRRSEFLRVGGFDENFVGNSYGDDYDLAVRLAEASGRTVYDPQASLIHLQVPSGGLRLKDKQNRASEKSRALSGCLMYVRHARRGCRWYMFYHYVLRRTILLKRNVKAWWRQPIVWSGLLAAWFEAKKRNQQGPTSRFIPNAPSLANRGNGTHT